MTTPTVVMLECPNCGKRFPVVLAAGCPGWCGCGLDFELDLDAGIANWKPDPSFPQSGRVRHMTELPRSGEEIS